MAERGLLAYFKSPDDARKAARRLNALGVEDIDIKRFDGFPGDGTNPINPYAGTFGSLGNLTLNGNFNDNRDAGILAAAGVSASGFSDGGGGGVSGWDVLLAATVDGGLYDKALNVCFEEGALH